MARPEPTPEQRSAWGRIGAHVAHANNDSRAMTNAARSAFLDKFEREVDPDGLLDPAERAKRAEHAKRAHMQRLALKSAESRRKTKVQKQRAVELSTSTTVDTPSVSGGVESSAARPTGSGTSGAGENASTSRGDIVDLAATSLERRAS